MAASFTGYAQVGIGTTDPKGVLDIVSTDSGLIIPRVATTGSVTAAVNGMIVYDISAKCLKGYQDDLWSDCFAVNTPDTPDPLPANITLDVISEYFIASVYDQDYLPYTTPLVAATLATAQTADGGNETTPLDVQGTLTTTGVTISIPFTVVTASVSLPAYSQTINIPAAYTQDGITRDVTFSYDAATYAVGTGTITTTLKAVGGILNVKQLDLQTGIGNDGLGYLLGQFAYATDDSGSLANLNLRAISAVPDRNIADANHQFVYLPITNPATGKTWLNNNLGAIYSDLTHVDFSLATQATSVTDFNAYGSLYQWGRYSDGHEIIAHTAATPPQDSTPPAGSSSSTAGPVTAGSEDANFYTKGTAPYDWLSTQDDARWNAGTEVAPIKTANDPCPIGYRVPTDTELENERLSFSTNDAAGGYASPLKFTLAGYRYYTDANLDFVGGTGYYWSSTKWPAGTDTSTYLGIGAAVLTTTSGSKRASGLSVRCIKD